MRLLRALLGVYIDELRKTEHRVHIQIRGEAVAGTPAERYVNNGVLTLNISGRAAQIRATDTGWSLGVRFGTIAASLHVRPIDIVNIHLLHAVSGRVVNVFSFTQDGIQFHGDNLSRQELELAEAKPEPTGNSAKVNHLKLIK